MARPASIDTRRLEVLHANEYDACVKEGRHSYGVNVKASICGCGRYHCRHYWAARKHLEGQTKTASAADQDGFLPGAETENPRKPNDHTHSITRVM